jgi:small nuclear ribonucleoprotein (snRNP)-like protein
VRWEERLLQEFDDLEQQAEGLHLAERDAAVAELSVSEYAEVELSSRLHASVGREVSLALVGGSTIEGRLSRAGRDWVLVSQGVAETVVRTGAVLRVLGASERAVPREVRSLIAKLGLGSALRQVAAQREPIVIGVSDGSTLRGRVRRVGADFVELTREGGQVELVAFDALVVLRRG